MKKAILIVVMTGFVLLLNPMLFGQLKIGEPAPDFKYKTLDGKECALSDHKGKVVILDFFSSRWLTSRNNIVHLELIHRKFKNKGVVVLGISKEKEINLKNFVNERFRGSDLHCWHVTGGV